MLAQLPLGDELHGFATFALYFGIGARFMVLAVQRRNGRYPIRYDLRAIQKRLATLAGEVIDLRIDSRAQIQSLKNRLDYLEKRNFPPREHP